MTHFNCFRNLRSSLVVLLVFASLNFGAARLFAVDEDGDGMSDVWARFYGVPSSDATLDYDADGLDNLAESTRSTDPNDFTSILAANLDVNLEGGTATITFPTVPARNYQPQISTDLVSWQDEGTSVLGSGDEASLTVALNGRPNLFARVRLLPDETLPSHRFTRWEEYILGVDPANPNVYPPFWNTTAFRRPWSHEVDEGPNSFVDDGYGEEGTTSQTNQVGPQPNLTFGGRPIQTAPSCAHYLLEQAPQRNQSKVYYKEFMPEPNASNPYKPKYYLRRKLVTSLEGGCPESAMGGTVTSTYDPSSGNLTQTSEGRPYSIPTNADTPDSPTHAKGSQSLDTYDDPPNEIEDCPGTGKADATLSIEYPTNTLISDTLAKLEPFHEDISYYYSAGSIATAYRNLSDDETSFDIKKLKFRFVVYNEGEAELPTTYTANWVVQFIPEDGSETTYQVGTWQKDVTTPQDEPPYSDPVTIDPQILNGGKDGTCNVCPLPVYIDVNYLQGYQPGQIVTKGTPIHLRAVDYYNGQPLVLPPGQPTWYRRQKQYDSSFSGWQKIEGTGLEIDHTTDVGGIFQFKAVFTAGGTSAEAHFLREEGNVTATSLHLVAPGEIDMVGVVDDAIQKDIRQSAYINLGSTGLRYPQLICRSMCQVTINATCLYAIKPRTLVPQCLS